MVDGGIGSRTGTTVITGNQDDLGTGLGNAAGDGSDTGLRNQLYGNPGLGIGIL